MSFYRTYRPQVIDEIDNASVREHLLALLRKDKKELPHAYLFTGPKGAGKTTAARVIAKLFNCEKPTKTGPCGACEQCLAIANGTSMDVIEMDAASNRGIDEIRQLRDRIGLSPSSAAFTIYIIDEVHMLTTEAFNALLKTLEEPPAHAVFVLATTDREKVPSTIQSRCMTMTFSRASSDELIHALSRIAKAEKMDINDEALLRVAKAADGSFRDAVKYLEQVSFSKGAISNDMVGKTLSLSDESFRIALLSHLGAHDVKTALHDVESARIDGRDMKSLLTDILGDLEHKLVSAATGTMDGVWTAQTTTTAIAIFTKAYGELRVSPIPELPVEVAVIEFCALGALPPPLKQQEVVVEHIVSEVKKGPEAAHGEEKPMTHVTVSVASTEPPVPSLGLLTMEKLVEHWSDFIMATKPYNHSVAGVLRSSRPKSVDGGIVTIEAFYKFHQEKLAETHTKQVLSDVLKKLFGEKVKIEIILGKK